MKKNVLQLIGSFHQGGSERQAVQLSKLLHADGTVNVFVATLNREGVLLDELAGSGIDPIPEFKLRSFHDLHFAEQVLRCAKFLKDQRIDIVHTHDFYTNVFGMAAALLAGVPFRVASKRETGGMRTSMQDRIERLAFGRAHRIVVNAGAVRDYLVDRKIDAGKIALIYNGLDLDRLRPATTDVAEIRRGFGIPENSRVVTLVANLRHEVKNQPMFLRAAGEVLAAFPETRFVLAGEGELIGKLEQLARGLGIAESVRFIGLCRDVPDLLFASDVCVLTSLNEGFSNSILEYMAAGKPVVATRVGGAAEAVIEGETGYLVESDDSAALAERIIRLLSDAGTRVAFGRRAREVVSEKFSTSAQLARTLELYARANRE